MRTLASVQQIKAADKIEGKDRIRYLSFEGVGWRVIGDSAMQPGDLVVYIEPDSVLPVRPEFEFLRSKCYSETIGGFRIKCMKMAGLFSEGIAFPLSILPAGNWSAGDNVTTVLGITKYDDYDKDEVTKPQSKLKKFLFKIALFRFFFRLFKTKTPERGWPSFLSKTDETRVQVLSYVFDLLKDMPVYITTKMDGQSLSAAYYKGEHYLCSRNVLLERTRGEFKDNSKYHTTVKMNRLQAILKQHHKRTGEYLAIQGEQCGPGIQGNKMGLSELTLYVFNIYSISERRYYGFMEMVDFCLKYGLRMVPIAGAFRFNFASVEGLLEYSKGNYDNGTPREGIVIRTEEPMAPAKGMVNMMSFKVINPDFILKYGL